MINNQHYFTYIATNHPRNTVLYIGVTRNVLNRENQHKIKLNKNSFTAKYNVNKIVYYETYKYVNDAIIREKQIKGWTRKKKIKLIEEDNFKWINIVEKAYK